MKIICKMKKVSDVFGNRNIKLSYWFLSVGFILLLVQVLNLIFFSFKIFTPLQSFSLSFFSQVVISVGIYLIIKDYFNNRCQESMEDKHFEDLLERSRESMLESWKILRQNGYLDFRDEEGEEWEMSQIIHTEIQPDDKGL